MLDGGPIFEIQQEVFELGCLRGEDCSPKLGMTFVDVPDAEELQEGAVYPASLICRGLRTMTSGERGHVEFVGTPVADGLICDMQVRCVIDPFADDSF